MGREKRARLKNIDEELSEELVVAHNTTKRPIWEEAKHYNKQQMHTYYYGKRIGMIM
jgi:hypothetical protein